MPDSQLNQILIIPGLRFSCLDIVMAQSEAWAFMLYQEINIIVKWGLSFHAPYQNEACMSFHTLPRDEHYSKVRLELSCSIPKCKVRLAWAFILYQEMNIIVKWGLSFHTLPRDEYYCKVRLELSRSTKRWVLL